MYIFNTKLINNKNRVGFTLGYFLPTGIFIGSTEAKEYYKQEDRQDKQRTSLQGNTRLVHKS